MKSFKIVYTRSVKHEMTLTAKSESEALKKFEPMMPENARILDIHEVDHRQEAVES